MMQPLGSSSRAGTARPGRLWWYNKKTEFYAFLSLLWVKSISAFLVFDRTAAPIWHTQTTMSGKHLTQFDRLPRGETPDRSRWPCISSHHFRLRRGRGPAAGNIPIPIKKLGFVCDLENGPWEMANFLHAGWNRREYEKSQVAFFDWNTPSMTFGQSWGGRGRNFCFPTNFSTTFWLNWLPIPTNFL